MAGLSRRAFMAWLSTSGLALTGIAAAPAAFANGKVDVLVLVGGTLIDGTGKKPRSRATIVIVGDRIIAVGGQSRIEFPAGVKVVDVRGKYVLPGLWDMHAHTENYPKILLPLFIANGVTAVREMMGFPHLKGMRDQIEAGQVLGPRMVIGSKLMDGPIAQAAYPGASIVVKTPEEARAAVREAKETGADFVKHWSLMSPELFEVITREARRQGLPISGHVPDKVPLSLAGKLGVRTQEHLHGLPIDTSAMADEYRALIANRPVDPANPYESYFFVRNLEMEAIKTYDERRAERLYATLRRHNTFLTPTLTVHRFFNLPPEVHKDDPRAKYLPPWLIERWNDSLGPPWTPEVTATRQAYHEETLRLVGKLAEAELPLIAGTDGGTLVAYIFAGFGVHDELGWLVDGGLTPMQAILAATRDAARAVDLGHLSGTVRPGKWADLLVVDADPLANIRNTQKIHAVITRGKLITRAEREKMLADVEAEAKVTPPPAAEIVVARCCGIRSGHS